jgi:hypothetical protein
MSGIPPLSPRRSGWPSSTELRVPRASSWRLSRPDLEPWQALRVNAELVEKISRWAETSGRALELRTARAVRSGGAIWVHQAVTYSDPTTGTQREGDVIGSFRSATQRLSLTLELAVECKSGKKHPWVALVDRSRAGFSPSRIQTWCATDDETWPGTTAERVAQTISERPSFNVDGTAVHAAAALGDDSQNVAMNAARQALAFARARARGRFLNDPPGTVPLKAVLPIVVSNAPFFTCELDEDGEISVEPIDQFDVLVPDESGYLSRVYVRNEASFGALVRDLASARRVLDDLLVLS